MHKTYWMALALLAGAVLPIQAGLNTRLGKHLESPSHASLISFIVGALGIILYILITRQTVSWTGLRTAPVYAWLGGLLGAFYVTFIILAFPKLGPGLTFGLIVAGQMMLSLVLEHFNILVARQQSINPMKLFGIALVIAGVIIIRRF